MPAFEHIIYDQSGPIVKITLNRPQKLNALNDRMMFDLNEAFDLVQADRSVRAVVLTGAGRAFSAGYDLSPRAEPLQGVEDWRTNILCTGRDVLLKMWSLRVPVITAVCGYALGGACDMVLASDVTVIAEDAKIGEPEIRAVASPPTLFMPWVVGIKKAKELLLTGEMIDGKEAYLMGIANKVVPAEAVQSEAHALAEKIAAHPAVAVELTKTAINHTFETMGIKAAIDYGVEIYTLLMMTEDARRFTVAVEEKGLKAALRDRQPGTPP